MFAHCKTFHNSVVNQNEGDRLWGGVGSWFGGGGGGGGSATHIIACSAWQCLQCGRAVACRFAHTRHGNMHSHISFPCLCLCKNKAL